MPLYSYAIAVGHDQTITTNIETVVRYPPQAVPMEPLGPISRVTLDSAQQLNGAIEVIWHWNWLSKADFQTLMNTYLGGFDVGSANVTIMTRAANETFMPCNAILWKPVPGVDYQREYAGSVADLNLKFRVIEALNAPDNGLLLETGFGLQLESGDYLLLG